MHTLWLCLLPSVSVPLSTPSATIALKLPRKFNSQLEMYRARVGHTRIDDVEGNIGKRQGRRIATGSYDYILTNLLRTTSYFISSRIIL